jgi:surface antigen
LGAVIKRQIGGRSQVLVAVRPATANWPHAARTGLDWAITAALEAPQGAAPVKWSSTAVAVRFDITASKVAHISGLTTDEASCRRFELIKGGTNQSFPGFACRGNDGSWTIAGTKEKISRPDRIQNARR